MPFQPAGYLPAPAGWNPPPPQHPPPYGYHRPYQPIVVNQHYYIHPPPNYDYHHHNGGASNPLNKLGLGSVVNLAKDVVPATVNALPQLYDDGLSAWHGYGSQLLNQTAALYDQISSRFNHVMTVIDQEACSGNETELFSYQPVGVPGPQLPPRPPSEDATLDKGGVGPKEKKKKGRDAPKGQTTAVAASVVSGNYFAKVDLYSNSRLPSRLPKVKL
jgi:hypothetical protein